MVRSNQNEIIIVDSGDFRKKMSSLKVDCEFLEDLQE